MRSLTAVAEVLAPVRRLWSRRSTTGRRFRRSKGAVIGCTVLATLVCVAVLAPWVAPHDPLTAIPADALARPGQRHPFGTDQFGRDILSRVIYGMRISLQMGLVSVGIAASLGLIVGLISGYYGGWIDIVLMRVIDVMMAFPGILLALTIVSMLGPSLVNLMIAVGISAIPTYARLVRGSVLAARENVYVDAARTVGCPDRIILYRHILPNIIAPMLVVGTLGVGSAILSAAALSFLGLGSQPPTPEWGQMLSEGRSYMRTHWWISTFPGLAIMTTVLAVNLMGDGLRDTLDPRLRM